MDQLLMSFLVVKTLLLLVILDYYLRQQFQKFIFRLNQPFLRIDQSAFTNVSIFDRPYLKCHLTLTR